MRHRHKGAASNNKNAGQSYCHRGIFGRMSHVTIIWSVVAASALLLAVMYACVWVLDRKAYASLAFACEALAIVGTVAFELALMRAESPTEWGELVRWSQIAIGARFIATVLFIR